MNPAPDTDTLQSVESTSASVPELHDGDRDESASLVGGAPTASPRKGKVALVNWSRIGRPAECLLLLTLALLLSYSLRSGAWAHGANRDVRLVRSGLKSAWLEDVGMLSLRAEVRWPLRQMCPSVRHPWRVSVRSVLAMSLTRSPAPSPLRASARLFSL